MKSHLLLACALLASASCSNSPTTPTTSGPGHPLGHALTQVSLGHGPWGVAISAGGTAYVTQPLTDSVARIDVATATVSGGLQSGNRPDDIIFNAAGTRAWTTNINDNSLSVIDVGANARISTVTGLTEPLRIRLAAGGSKLYVTQTNDSVRILTASSGATVKQIGLGGPGYGMAATPAGDRVWVAAGDGNLYEILTATDVLGRTITMGGTPQDVAISANGSTMYVANEAGWVGVYSLASATRVDSIPVTGAFGLALTPDGTELWVTRASASMLTVIATSSRVATDSILTFGTPRHIAFTPDGSAALIANEQGAAQVVR